MSDEDLFISIVAGVMMLGPFILVGLCLPCCVSYSRAKTWDKQRKATLEKTANGEANPLVTSDSDDEADFYDTEDEEDLEAQKKEQEEDSHLTFNQKWRKEFGRFWRGKSNNDILRAKKREERKERRKLARVVVKAMERREGRRMGLALPAEEMELPAYRKE